MAIRRNFEKPQLSMTGPCEEAMLPVYGEPALRAKRCASRWLTNGSHFLPPSPWSQRRLTHQCIKIEMMSHGATAELFVMSTKKHMRFNVLCGTPIMAT